MCSTVTEWKCCNDRYTTLHTETQGTQEALKNHHQDHCQYHRQRQEWPSTHYIRKHESVRLQFLESIHYVQDIAGHFGPNKVPSQCDSHSDDNKVWFLIQSEPSGVGGAGQNIASGPLSIVSICPGHFLYIKTTKIINPTELEVQLFNEGRTADLPLSV